MDSYVRTPFVAEHMERLNVDAAVNAEHRFATTWPTSFWSMIENQYSPIGLAWSWFAPRPSASNAAEPRRFTPGSPRPMFACVKRGRAAALHALTPQSSPLAPLIACAGLLPQWHGRLIGWLIISTDAGLREVLHVAGALTRTLDLAQEFEAMRRIEVTVRSRFVSGHTFIRRLGFIHEAKMPSFDPAGDSHDLYSRVAVEAAA